MTNPEKPYDDIPGTIVFDGEKSRQGYQFNVFCSSLMNPQNRAAFLADPKAYLAKFAMSEAQREAVLKRDWKKMLQLGGNIFYINRIAMCDKLSGGQLQASMSGMDHQDYLQMMLNGGRPIEGNRSKKEKHIG